MTDEPTPTPPPGSPPRWRLPLIVLAGVVAIVLVVAALASRVAPSPTPPVPTPTLSPLPSEPEGGLLATHAEIEQRVAWGKAGIEPFAAALDDLIVDADQRLGETPDPQEPLDIRGTGGPFVDDSASAYGLALAYVATGDQRYADHAAEYLRAWSTTTKTTKHTCPNDGDCQTSLIIGRTAPGFVFAEELIEPSGAMSAADTAAFDGWLHDVILPTASQRDNNWGDAGTFMRLAITSHLGDATGFDAAVARWRAMMDLVPADGYIPEETRRGDDGISYTQEALQYKVASAVIAARRGVDLWSYTGADGGTLQGALEYLARFADPNVRWPWHPTAEFPTPSPIWELVAAHWPEPAFDRLVEAGRPYGDVGHAAIRWTTITSARPPDGLASASPSGALASASTSAGPSASPAPAASPTPTVAATPTPSPDPTPTPIAALPPPVVSLRTGHYRDRGHLPLRIDWSAPTSGEVRRSQLERWEDGRRAERLTFGPGAVTRHDEGAPTGVDLDYQVRVSLRGAGTSPWAKTTLRLRFIDDTSGSIDYGGSWHIAGHADYQRDAAHWSTDGGATATIDFDGSAIAWLGPVGPGRGRATVRLDGESVGTVDLDAATFDARHVVFVAAASTAGEHRLEIVVRGGTGAVAVDGFVIQGIP